MPLIPLITLIEDAVQNATFSASVQVDGYLKHCFIRCLKGVPLGYSCPWPLLVDAQPSRRTPFQQETVELLQRAYVDMCKITYRGVQNFIQLTHKAQFETLFIHSDFFRRLMMYPGYASGDMYGIGASMLFDKELQLRIVQDGNKGRIDRSAMVQGFLNAFLADRTRVTITDSQKIDARAFFPTFECLTGQVNPAKQRDISYLEWLSLDLWTFMQQKNRVFIVVDLFFGTNYVALRFQKPEKRREMRRIVRSGWDVDFQRWPKGVDGVVKKIGTFLKDKGFKEPNQSFPKNKHVVVLWLRFTGKKGGAHVEYDTSFEGLRQLLKCAHEQGNDWAILVGDKPAISQTGFNQDKQQRRALKLQQIMQGSPIRVVNLTEFWTDPAWTPHFPKRTDQFKVFEVLHQHNHVKHLGARSGNLESLALMGYQVRYFEDRYDDSEEALDKKRMESWHETVGYKRIQIAEVPTRSGKYIIRKEEHYPKWTYPKRFDPTTFVAKPKKLTPSKDENLRTKPSEINATRPGEITVFELREVMERPEGIIPIYSVTPSPHFELRTKLVPVRYTVNVPLYEKGFSVRDLQILGQYLVPDPYFKIRNPL